jgi:hypothetical protein
MAQTFSPTVSMDPLMAAPMAMPAQLFLATLVEPMPGTMKGTLSLISLLRPIVVSVETFSKVALSESASQPKAPAAVPMIEKWDRS